MASKQIVRNLKKKFKAHPEKYPAIPEHTYFIVGRKSDGTLLRASEVEDYTGELTLEIMPIPHGHEKGFFRRQLN